jgi:D-alanyl-D-alanine carboxypeptidase
VAGSSTLTDEGRALATAPDDESLCAGQRSAQRTDGAFGRLGPAIIAWACDPLAAVVGLPPTELEREEPEQLYALVTRDRPVEPLEYAPEDLVRLFGGPYQARQEVADQLVLLLDAAREAGHPDVRVNSGFRDYWTQAGTYEDWVRRSGGDEADRISARPGHSEHQLGLAVDLTGQCGGFACFGDSPEGRWVADNAHRFGFIIRYPQGGDEVTGYAYEPWHLRYVGPRAAWTMHLSDEVYWEKFAPDALKAVAVDR